MNSFLSSKSRSAQARRSSAFTLTSSWSENKRNAFRQPVTKRREPKKIWQILYSMFF